MDMRKYNQGNPNIKEISQFSTGPTTKIGKFRISLNNYKKSGGRNIPDEIKELFEWYLAMKQKDVDCLLELKNLYQVLKVHTSAEIFDKIITGENLSKGDREMLKLLKDTLVDTQKLEFGEKSIIEHKVTYKDVRDQIFSDRMIVDAKIIEEKKTEESPQSQ